jgi:hypothetical protein
MKYMILAVTMGFDVSYDLFIISLNSTPAEQLTLEYILLPSRVHKEFTRSPYTLSGVHQESIRSV